jgi:hypothetical protein
MNVETVGSPGPDDEVWCVVSPRTGHVEPNWTFVTADSARRSDLVSPRYGYIVARWDAEGLRWIEAPAPTIMVELPVYEVQRGARLTGEDWWIDACRAALEREGLA